MKVGFLVLGRQDGKGGLENVLLHVVEGLKARDIESIVFFLQPFKDRGYKKNFESYYEFSMPPILRDKNFFRPRVLYNLFLRLGVRDILKRVSHSCDALVILNVEPVLYRLRKEFVLFREENPAIPLFSWPHGTLSIDSGDVVSAALDLFDEHLAISKGLMTELSVGFNRQNVTFVGNPIREAQLIPRDARRFIYVGRTDPEKRVLDLIGMLAGLRGEWTLDLIGGSMTRGRDDELKRLVIEKGLVDRVRLHGWQEDPWSLVDSAGVLLLNSKYEGFGLVIAEAMMRGIPCVSSNCPVGPASIIREGVNGWLFELDDQSRCLGILQSILDGETSLPSRESVRDSVVEFSVDRVVDRFRDALQEAKSFSGQNK
ncbi:MAG TPA: glycosyltransferase [Pseudomonas sp.]|jgi:UDP-D-galactose:(glucosyl)LPS alpha-1,6-D-galactosyltransferase|uniref:glycosyltransferase n=1 Tax=Pseudomonas sp. TaxID=306 RepID=UPI002BE428B7|nr:glycosyltransferase [Pseudomonas sp.]HTO18501.1 glycosyltransferase [Pseudomonas sp.]